MPLPGKKPNDRPSSTSRYNPKHDWIEVENVPYKGKKPTLPKVRLVMNPKGHLDEFPVSKRTQDWWNNITTMPHCILWTPSDWQFAVDTAMVHAEAAHGRTNAMGELRQRERVMGTTIDARRDLRIRYIDPEPVAPVVQLVSNKDSRKRDLLGDA